MPVQTYSVAVIDVWSGDYEYIAFGLTKEQADEVAKEANHIYNNELGECYQIITEEEEQLDA